MIHTEKLDDLHAAIARFNKQIGAKWWKFVQISHVS